jgi:predicted ATPase/DNA-binding SARP family transcriptional activator
LPAETGFSLQADPAAVGPYARDVLQIALLGPLEVRRDGEFVPVPGGKASELLVRLALDAGVVVGADRLIDDLWAVEALTTRRNTLQSKVAMLRRALRDPSAIESRELGYRLVVEPSQVDALAVPAQVGTASRLLDAGDARAAADLCASTLQLYRGDLLPAAGDGDWVDPHRVRLHEARMTLVEMGLSARVRLGDVRDVVGELEAAVAAYPFREGLWELLITALYRAGRQADALATYQRIKGQLATELGLDPGPNLQKLEQRILTQDASLGAAARGADLVDPGTPVGNLPSMSADLVGRGAEVAALCARLAHERLVEVVGPGGIGKTAVALATGRRLSSSGGAGAGGVWLARLETAVTADDVIDTLVAALDVPGEEALFERLRGTDPLVILDNCEHVVDAAAALAVRLLDAVPGLRILCTSQVPLDVDGEAVVELEPLTLPDAAELFVHRASAQRLQQRGSSDSQAGVLDLCRALDGLPLAIELAAARTRTLSIEEITRRLDDRFHVLSDPTSRRPERRRSLRSTIRWSYDLLFPDDQRGLWALATFSGGASLPAVEFVLQALDVPAAAAIDVVGRLAGRSLVIVDDVGGSRPGGAVGAAQHSTRYRLLDSIRAFALDAMAEAGLGARALGAHATWFADAARSSTAGVRSSSQADQLAFARAERANIDAALAWSATHDALQSLNIVNGFGWAWVVLGDSRGAQRILAALEVAGDAGAPRERAGALLLAAWLEASTGHLELARSHIAAAAELADTISDVELQARSAYHLAYVVSHHGEFQQALELTDRSRALLDELDRPWDQAANGLFAARAALSAGDPERGVAALERVGNWLRTVDDPWLHVRHEAALGELARVQHRFDDAVMHIGRAAQRSRDLGFRQTEAFQVSSLGRAQCQAGDYDAGSATLELAIEKAEATGDVRLAALARVHWGRVLRAAGDLARARAALEAAAQWHRGAGGGEQAALGECLLAAMDAADQVPGAHERLVAIVDVARHEDAAHVEVFALDALARIAAEAGDIAIARELCAQADRRMEAASHFITDRDRTDAHWVRSLPRSG